ncbi:MAG: hypothetical protein RIN56_06250 [Sporomusaceae bacterium]|nr:hypothetical protein [Sporomusaceae bacterium]
MSNQTLMWSILVMPWLTLAFMKKDAIKRFMPVALLSALASVLAVEMGENLGWFVYGESAYPLRTGYYIIFGLNIVTTMWLFYFLYGRFWKYTAIDIVLNFGFIYLFHVYFLGGRGLFREVGITPFTNALIPSAVGALLYAYQMWQEGIFVPAERTATAGHSRILRPEAAKPLDSDERDDDRHD